MCQSVRKSLIMYEIKTLQHGKCLNDFYSLVPMHKFHLFDALTHSSFLMHLSRGMKIVFAHFSWNNLYLLAVMYVMFCLLYKHQ